MRDLIEKFQSQANGAFSENEKRILGIGTRASERKRLDERVQNDVDLGAIRSNNRPFAPKPLMNYQGKDSDGEIAFYFEDSQDAEDMFSFFLDANLLEAGEVVLTNIEGQSRVAFMPHVLVQKPEMIQAALLAYEDQMYFEDEEEEEAFESFVAGLTDALLEKAPNKTSGAPKRKPEMGNPFHDKETGELSGVKNHAKKKGGSWAYKKTKLKFTGKGKTKEGGILGKYGSTTHPCGRAARAQGKDVRCWDGTDMSGGAKVGKALGKKKGRKEDMNISDISAIMEMRAKYGTLV